MKQLILAVALILGILGGTIAVSALTDIPAIADCGGTANC